MVKKLLKKIFGAFGFKLVDKNLLKSQRLISSKSHLNVKLRNVIQSIFLLFDISMTKPSSI